MITIPSRWMHRALLLAAVFSAPGRAAEAVRPAVSVPEPSHYFGAIREGDKVEHVFGIENNGSKPVRLEKVVTVCGCTTALLSGEQIPPGQSAQLKVTLDSTGMDGSISRRIFVQTDDALRPRLSLDMVGVVKAHLLIHPTPVYFGEVDRRHFHQQIIHIVPLEGEGIAFKEVKAPQGVAAILAPRRYPGQREGRAAEVQGYQLDVRLTPDIPIGSFKGQIKLIPESGSPLDLRLIAVQADVQGEWSITPASVNLRPEAGETARELKLIRSDSSPLKVEKLELQAQGLDASFKPLKGLNGYLISIRYHGGLVASAIHTLKVHINDPLQPVVDVPVSVYFKKL